MNLMPILLPDSGERTLLEGMVNGYAFVLTCNPDHITRVIAERKRRQMISERNFRQWA